MGEDRVVPEADWGDGDRILEVGAELPGPCGAVAGGGEGQEQGVGDRVGVAAIVHRPAGADQVPQVPVGGELHLAAVEVEFPSLQGRQILLPGQGYHGDLPVQQGQVFGDILGAGHPEAVLLTDQHRQRPGDAGVLACGGESGDGGVIAVALLQVLGVEGRDGGEGKLGGPGVAGEEGVRQHLPLDAAAEGGAGLGAGEEAALRRVEADELHEGCGPVSLLDLAGSGGVVPGGVHRQKLYLPGGEQVDRRVQVLCVDQGNGGHGERLALPPVAVGL